MHVEGEHLLDVVLHLGEAALHIRRRPTAERARARGLGGKDVGLAGLYLQRDHLGAEPETPHAAIERRRSSRPRLTSDFTAMGPRADRAERAEPGVQPSVLAALLTVRPARRSR